jgi:rubrerythrin
MQRFFSLSREIEQTVGRIYEILAAEERYPAKLRAVFRQLSYDESDHAAQLGLAGKLVDEVDFEAAVSVEEITLLLGRTKNLLARVAGAPMEEAEALRLAKVLEADFRAVHLLAAARMRDGKLREMFQALARGDEAHLKTLTDYLDQAG